MGRTVREALPFEYVTCQRNSGTIWRCHGCTVYEAQVRCEMALGPLKLCRSCLERMRVTLKLAWKDLLPEKGRVRT